MAIQLSPFSSLKAESELIDSILEKRIQVLLPQLMERTNIDLWIVTSREYNEDPVIRTLLPSKWFAARRRTILVMHLNNSKVDTYAVARYNVGNVFKKAWNPEEQPNQLSRLEELIDQLKPQKIGLNYSTLFAQADGITHSEFEEMTNKWSTSLMDKIISAEPLAVAWLETRIPEEIDLMKKLAAQGHDIIKKGFSKETIKIGETTTEDIQWFFREEIRRRGFKTWFHPSVDIQRSNAPEHNGDFSGPADVQTVQYGDLLHVDIGITYARLNTDQQQHAYVFRPGEDEIPADLKLALKVGNDLQDHLTNQFKTGRSGNEILKLARKAAIAENIKPSIYSHPIGYYGHGSGPTIGMWDNQGDTPGRGDYQLYPNTGYSIELNATVDIPSWNKEVKIMLEEDGWFDGENFFYYDGRQENIIEIRF